MDKKKLFFSIKFLLLLFVIVYIAASFFSFPNSSFGNVALIPVKGVILVDGSASAFGEEIASSSEIVDFIKDANADDSVKAIVFDINSPGGSAVASKEISDAIKRTNKTTVAVIREVGASGGYWVASAADHIIANEMSITGSIGVIGSYIEFDGLLNRYNLTYQRFVGGEFKDMGSPFKKLESDERAKIQSKIDIIHDYFIQAIAVNRDLPVDKVKEVSTGEFFLGIEALDLGLIDSVGDLDSAQVFLKEDLNVTSIDFVMYSSPSSFLDLLSNVFSENSFFIGRGIGSSLRQNDDLRLFT